MKYYRVNDCVTPINFYRIKTHPTQIDYGVGSFVLEFSSVGYFLMISKLVALGLPIT